MKQPNAVGKIVPKDLTQCRAATHLQCVENSISTVDKAKFNKARYAFTCIYSIVISMQAISEKKHPNASLSFIFIGV